MPGDKARFEARELTPPGTSSDKDGDNREQYTGPERRRGNRRSGKDRRSEVRFEIGKENRRKNRGRRHDDKAPDFW